MGENANTITKGAEALENIRYYNDRASAREAVNSFELGLAQKENDIMNDPRALEVDPKTNLPKGLADLQAYKQQFQTDFNKNTKDQLLQGLTGHMIDQTFASKNVGMTMKLGNMARERDMKALDSSYKIGLITGDENNLKSVNTLAAEKRWSEDETQQYKDNAGFEAMKRVPSDQIPAMLDNIEKRGGMSPMALDSLKEQSMQHYETKQGTAQFKEFDKSFAKDPVQAMEDYRSGKFDLSLVAPEKRRGIESAYSDFVSGKAMPGEPMGKPMQDKVEAMVKTNLSQAKATWEQAHDKTQPFESSEDFINQRAQLMNSFRQDNRLATTDERESKGYLDSLKAKAYAPEWVQTPDGKQVQVPHFQKLWNGYNHIDKAQNGTDVMTLPNGKQIIYHDGKQIGNLPADKDLRNDTNTPMVESD